MLTAGAVRAESVGGYYDLGVFAFEEGNYREALFLLKTALAQNPKDAYVNYYLGKTYVALNKLSDAEYYFKTAQKMDSAIPGLSYEMAMLAYKFGDYHQALLHFENIISENPSDALAVYHAGVSAFMLKDYEKAQKYLERSADISPAIKPNALYYAGICSYKMADFAKALEQLSYVCGRAQTESLKKDAEMWLHIVSAEKGRQKPYFLYAKAGLQYDDNVTLAAVDADLISDESDIAAVGYMTGRYSFIKQDQLDFGVGYSHYQTLYQDLDEYDLTGALPEVYGVYRVSLVTFGLAYIPSYYWVDSDSYLMQHQITPEIRFQINDNNEVALSYSYSRNNYFTEEGRDGHANEIGMDIYHGFADIKAYLFGGIRYTDNTASARDQYYTEGAATFGVSYDILDTTNLIIYGSYFDKSYDHRDSTYKKKRDDSRYFVSAAWNQGLFYEWLKLSAEYTYTKNDSNISEFEYDRNTIALYVIANF